LIFSSSFGVLTLQYVPAVPQPDAKDRLSDDARVVSNRRRYLLEVDLRISNHSERPFCAPNLTFVPLIPPTTGMAESDMNKIFVAKTRLSAHGGCDEKYRRFYRG